MSFVCALLVVLIHLGEDCAVLPTRLANKVMGNGVCLIAVPYFFVVSGFFVAHADWRNACFKRLRTLLVPYLIWEILMLLYGDLITLACNLRAGRGLLSNISLAPLDVLREIGVLDWSCAPVHGALWYVRALLLFILCLPMIRFFVRRFGWWCVGVLWLVAFAVVAGLISIPLGFRGFFEWSFPPWGLAYFAAGICLADHPIPDRIGKRLSLVALVFGLALLGYVLVRNLSCEYSSGGGQFLFRCCFIGAVWYAMPSASWPKWLTSLSFPIFIVHYFFSYVYWFYMPVGLKTSLAAYFVRLLVTVFCSIGLALLMKRAMPRFYRVAFGGRG